MRAQHEEMYQRWLQEQKQGRVAFHVEGRVRLCLLMLPAAVRLLLMCPRIQMRDSRFHQIDINMHLLFLRIRRVLLPLHQEVRKGEAPVHQGHPQSRRRVPQEGGRRDGLAQVLLNVDVCMVEGRGNEKPGERRILLHL